MTEQDDRLPAGFAAPGEYVPSGEAQGASGQFSATDVASAFHVATDRVHQAFAGEFGATSSDTIDSKQAQHLVEVLLVESPLADREAALMKLGAFTPRPDHEWGVGEAAPWEESDRVVGEDDHLSQH